MSVINLINDGSGVPLIMQRIQYLLFVFGKRKDFVFKELKAMLAPFGINRYYTDNWGAYERHL